MLSIVLMFNFINSYPRCHRNSFSVKIWRGKSLWKDANNGYNRCKGSEGSATCKTHRLTHKNSNVTESWWENFLRTYWRSFYWRSLASFPSTPMSGPFSDIRVALDWIKYNFGFFSVQYAKELTKIKREK